MAEPTPERNGPKFSSRLTRRLSQEADNIFIGGKMDGVSLDEQFEQLRKEVQEATECDEAFKKDLANLASLIDASGEQIGVNGTFKLNLSEDRMTMTLQVTPAFGNGEPVTVKDVVDELKKRKITRGVLLKAINEMVTEVDQNKEPSERVVVRGAPPIPGLAPWIAYFGRSPGGELEEVKPESLLPGADEAILCEQGDTIAYIRQGDPGRVGYTADGEELPPTASKDLTNLEAGRNVLVMSNCYVADAEGAVVLKDGCISVQPALVFYHDLDSHDSPVQFDGSIIVHGGVKSDVEIVATEDITIDRVVEGASIFSTGGNIVLHAGIAGRNRGKIVAAKDVICGYAENAKVTAGNDIILGVGSLNSQMTANRDVIAEAGRGSITGGVIMAGHAIKAKRIGSCGTQTVVMAGISSKALPALEEINKTSLHHQERLKEIEGLITQFDRAVRDPRMLSHQEQQTYINLHKLRLVTNKELDKLKDNRREILQESDNEVLGSVIIYQKLEANVTFHIGALSTTHRIDKGPLTFTCDANHSRIIRKGTA